MYKAGPVVTYCDSFILVFVRVDPLPFCGYFLFVSARAPPHGYP